MTVLEELLAVARRAGNPMVEIGLETRWVAPDLVDAVCDEMDRRFVVEEPGDMIAADGFIESEGVRIPVSRWGDPRHGGSYTFWLGAADAHAVEDYLDERARIVAAIDKRVPARPNGGDAARRALYDAFAARCRKSIDLTSFDLEAFAAAHGTPLDPADPFDVLSHAETRREARRRQRMVHLSGWLDDEFLLEAGRDRAQVLAGAFGPNSERYAAIARDLNDRLGELVDKRRRLLGVTFAVGQRSFDEAGLRKAITVLRIACDDAQREVDRVAPVLEAARRVAGYLPFADGAPRDVGTTIEREVDRAFGETMMNLARLALGKLIDLAWECCYATTGTDRELAAVRIRILLYEEYEYVKAELGTT